jgi:hypothetical protein
MYVPDKWVRVIITPKDGEPIDKILAGWFGGYLSGDSCQLNSGIKSEEDFGDYYEFTGYSGSVYKCYKGSEGLTTMMVAFFDSMKSGLEQGGKGTIEIIKESMQ